MIRLQVAGLDAMIQALQDLQQVGVPRAQAELDDALDSAAEVSYGLAHVHDGELRASQSHGSTHGRAFWAGQVSYSSRGAAFEIRRGGDHSAFIDGVAAATEPEFEAAVDVTFDGL